jgi:hypothetical protein
VGTPNLSSLDIGEIRERVDMMQKDTQHISHDIPSPSFDALLITDGPSPLDFE